MASSLGYLYRAGTELLGYRLADEHKVMGAAHDAGAALGAALKVHADLGGPPPPRRVRLVFGGPPLPARDQVRRLLDRRQGLVTVTESAQVERDTAALLEQDRVVGWVQGCSEFGPRALGNRSILADPRPEASQDLIGSSGEAPRG
jgi:predicted NodU family carbamoyl transferase